MGDKHLLLYCMENPLCKLMHEMCEKWGFELSWESESNNVPQIIREQPIQLVIIASNLKSYSLEEWALAKTLRKMGCRLPIIAISDHALPGDSLRAYQCGIDELLVKPIEVENIRQYIKRHLENADSSNYIKHIPLQKENLREHWAV